MTAEAQAAQIRDKARDLARSGRFCGWRLIEIELRFMEGVREAAGCFGDHAFRDELDGLCRATQKALGIPSVQVTLRSAAVIIPAEEPSVPATPLPAQVPQAQVPQAETPQADSQPADDLQVDDLPLNDLPLNDPPAAAPPTQPARAQHHGAALPTPRRPRDNNGPFRSMKYRRV